MNPVMIRIVCSCAWTGEVPTRGLCPGCGANWTHRVEPHRLHKLRQVAARKPGDPQVRIEPMMARWLTDPKHCLIERSNSGWQLTMLGERVILQAQLADRESELKREIVAESITRHAGLPER